MVFCKIMTKKIIQSSLIQFSVENFGCFRDRVDFSMASRKGAKNTFPLKNTDDQLLKSSIIYGPNASGKSTLLQAMDFMDTKIRKSTDAEHVEKMSFSPFLMEEGYQDKPSFFEIIFLQNEKIYQYNFSLLSDHSVIEENLFDVTDNKKELFSRNKKEDKFYVNKDFVDDDALRGRMKDKNLFLSVVTQWNQEIEKNLTSFFLKELNIMNGDALQRYTPHTAEEAIKKPEFKNEVLQYLKEADFCIHDFQVREMGIPKELRGLAKKNKEVELPKIFKTIDFLHSKYDRENNKIDDVVINQGEESTGTLTFFGGLGPIINTLKEGKVLIIDELNSSLHPLLCKFIVDLFHSEKTNPHNAQLIFTTHDVTLLSNTDSIDRDQFWFTDRDQYGKAKLFSLAEFKERKDITSFEKRYLEGNYGAIPFIDTALFEEENG